MTVIVLVFLVSVCVCVCELVCLMEFIVSLVDSRHKRHQQKNVCEYVDKKPDERVHILSNITGINIECVCGSMHVYRSNNIDTSEKRVLF